jgi:hypothetical protein
MLCQAAEIFDDRSVIKKGLLSKKRVKYFRKSASDGIVYAYPYQDRRRLLKIMAFPREDRRRGIFCLEERLRFLHSLGTRGAPVILVQPSPQGYLFETFHYEPDLRNDPFAAVCG